MQAVDLHPVPLLVSFREHRPAGPSEPVLDEFVAGLAVVYMCGLSPRRRLVSYQDLDLVGWSRQTLRRQAADELDHRREAIKIYGQPPALMLSFAGLESSLLLATRIWDDLEKMVPGNVVVGVPARDVVIVTGSRSPSGMTRVRRAVDRMFFARQRHPLSGRLLMRRGRFWSCVCD